MGLCLPSPPNLNKLFLSRRALSSYIITCMFLLSFERSYLILLVLSCYSSSCLFRVLRISSATSWCSKFYLNFFWSFKKSCCLRKVLVISLCSSFFIWYWSWALNNRPPSSYPLLIRLSNFLFLSSLKSVKTA